VAFIDRIAAPGLNKNRATWSEQEDRMRHGAAGFGILADPGTVGNPGGIPL